VLLVVWLLWVVVVVVAEVTLTVVVLVELVTIMVITMDIHMVDVVVTKSFFRLKKHKFCPSVFLHLGKTIF
jgi:hypothetical protein